MGTAIAVVAASLLLGSDPLKEPAPTDFAKFLRECSAEFKKKEKAFTEKWGLDDIAAFRMDRKNGIVTLISGKKGQKILAAKFQVIGTFNTEKKTFLWAWANEAVDESLKSDSRKLRKYGETNKLKQLTEKGWEDDLDGATTMLALAVKLLNTDGAIRLPVGKVLTFVVLREHKLIDEK